MGVIPGQRAGGRGGTGGIESLHRRRGLSAGSVAVTQMPPFTLPQEEHVGD